MPLQSSGSISLSDVNVELGNSSTQLISLNDSAVRTLFGVSSGSISLSDGYGKSNKPFLLADNFTQSYDVSAQTTWPAGVIFSYDGTKMYVQSLVPNYNLNRYNLSSAWDLTTASFHSARNMTPYNFFASGPVLGHWKSDGTRFYGVDTSQDRGRIIQLDFSTPYDISSTITANYVTNLNLNNATFGLAPPGALAWFGRGVTLSSNGIHLYYTYEVLSPTQRYLVHYTLSTPYDVTTLTKVSEFRLDTIGGNFGFVIPSSLRMSNDGKYLYIFSTNSRLMGYLTLGTPYYTSTYTSQTSITLPFNSPSRIYINPKYGYWPENESIKYFFMTGDDDDKIYRGNV